MTDGDLFAASEAEYAAGRRPRLVTVDAGWFLGLEGRGHPSSPEFSQGVAWLSACAAALKDKAQASGRPCETGRLEVLWHLDPGYFEFEAAPHSAWNWTLLTRMPDCLGENDLEPVLKSLLAQGTLKAVGQVGFTGFEEGLCAQVLHVGPWEASGQTLELLQAFIERKGLTPVGRRHEILLSGPDGTPPEKRKTIIRLPVL